MRGLEDFFSSFSISLVLPVWFFFSFNTAKQKRQQNPRLQEANAFQIPLRNVISLENVIREVLP